MFKFNAYFSKLFFIIALVLGAQTFNFSSPLAQEEDSTESQSSNQEQEEKKSEEENKEEKKDDAVKEKPKPVAEGEGSEPVQTEGGEPTEGTSVDVAVEAVGQDEPQETKAEEQSSAVLDDEPQNSVATEEEVQTPAPAEAAIPAQQEPVPVQEEVEEPVQEVEEPVQEVEEQPVVESPPVSSPNVSRRPNSVLYQMDRNLETYVDGLVAALAEKDKVPGLTLSVVQNGKIILKKGYGIADVAGDIPVDAETTMFRIGSVSKTFTYISLMQMVENGEFTLDTVVNTLLPAHLQIPDQGYENPILIWHLMTHTAGFEDSALGHLFFKDPNKVPSLEKYLAEYSPERVREPGLVASYSNYSVAVAGQVIAEVSGMPFEAYVEENIFEPLGMNNSTFREPIAAKDMRVSEALEDNYSKGYNYSNGWWVEKGFEHISNIGPAGAASSTANDMARYMLTILNRGSLEGQRIYSRRTAVSMRQTLHSNGPGYLPGVAYGFMTKHFGQYNAFGHGGATLRFYSQMMMIPDMKAGVFVSTNLANSRSVSGQLVRQIFEYMDPKAKPAKTPEPSANFFTEGQKFVGPYLTTRRGYSNMEKFFLGFQGVSKVSITNDGYLMINEKDRFVRTGPLTFIGHNSDTRLVFKEDENGKIESYSAGYGLTANYRVSFWESADAFNIFFVLTVIIAFACVTGAWLRRHVDIRETMGESFAGGLMPLTAFFWLFWIFLFCKATLVMTIGGSDVFFTYPNANMFSYPSTYLSVSVWVGNFVVLLSVINIAAVWNIWQRGRWPFWRRMRHTVGSLTFATMAMVINIWNLVGFGML